MLFFDYKFLFLFLPLCFVGYYALLRYRPSLLTAWLALCSVVFYSIWDYRNLLPLFVSILLNYTFGIIISNAHITKKKLNLVIALSLNLLLLGYYKYASFIIGLFPIQEGTFLNTSEIELPLGISFFTFTQIAYLVDTYQNKCREYSFKDYLLFVTYFPHLIAGPIIHHKEMMPQFKSLIQRRFKWDTISLGLGIFVIGLLKKVVIADYFIYEVAAVFDRYPDGPIHFIDAWAGAISYTLQIYFDFSGYCDMAVGLSKMLGVKLPINFNSPYKSKSIIEFWRRWHITLSRFLRDYLYIPLGGNRKGEGRRYLNLIITMLLGGLWHGAGWTFILWGALHGGFLALNNMGRTLKQKMGIRSNTSGILAHLSMFFTFFLVSLAWVPFRATNLATTLNTWKGCLLINGFSIPKVWASKLGVPTDFLNTVGITVIENSPVMRPLTIPLFAIILLIVFYAPNSMDIFSRFRDKMALFDKESLGTLKEKKFLRWAPTKGWAFTFAILLILSLWCRHSTTEFLYFQF